MSSSVTFPKGQDGFPVLQDHLFKDGGVSVKSFAHAGDVTVCVVKLECASKGGVALKSVFTDGNQDGDCSDKGHGKHLHVYRKSDFFPIDFDVRVDKDTLSTDKDGLFLLSGKEELYGDFFLVSTPCRKARPCRLEEDESSYSVQFYLKASGKDMPFSGHLAMLSKPLSCKILSKFSEDICQIPLSMQAISMQAISMQAISMQAIIKNVKDDMNRGFYNLSAKDWVSYVVPRVKFSKSVVGNSYKVKIKFCLTLTMKSFDRLKSLFGFREVFPFKFHRNDSAESKVFFYHRTRKDSESLKKQALLKGIVYYEDISGSNGQHFLYPKGKESAERLVIYPAPCRGAKDDVSKADSVGSNIGFKIAFRHDLEMQSTTKGYDLLCAIHKELRARLPDDTCMHVMSCISEDDLVTMSKGKHFSVNDEYPGFLSSLELGV